MAAVMFQRTAFRSISTARRYATAGGKREQDIPVQPEDQVLSKDESQEPLSASPLPSARQQAQQNHNEQAASSQQNDGYQIRKESNETAESLAARYLDMPGSSSSALSAADQSQRSGPSSRPGRRSLSSIEKRRRLWTRLTVGAACLLGFYYAWDSGRDWDDEQERQRLGKLANKYLGLEEDAQSSSIPLWKLRWARTRTRFIDTMDYFNKPAWEPLIPPPLPETHQRPYTLVIELDDILVHSEWSRDHGWRTAKRPGIEDFLGYLSQFYEIVVFTEAPHYTATPVLDKIDPLQYYFVYRLFRDSTRYTNGALVKDLSYLGRDLKKVIQLDTSPVAVQTQPENAILLPPWHGSKKDSRLLEYLPFLEAIAINAVQDVRPLLAAYKDKDIPKEFAARQAEYKRQHVAEWEKRRANSLGGFSLAGLFGLSSGTETAANEPPPTFYERERQRYLDHYKQESQFFKDNESNLLKQMEADRDKQMKEMKNSFFGFISTLGQQPAPVKSPEDQAVIDSKR